MPGFGPQPPGSSASVSGPMPGGGAVTAATEGGAAAFHGDANFLAFDGSGVAPSIAGLASLDVEIPQDGVEFLFTTPRGKVEILARPVSQSLVSRLWGIGGLLAAIALLWIATRPGLRRIYAAVAGTLVFAIVLVVGGLASMVLGVLPLAGLIVALIGAGLIVRRIAHRSLLVAAQ